MSALSRFTLRSLAASRVRTLVTIAGVALAAALLTAVATSFTSLEDYLYRVEVERNGTWSAEVRLPDAADALGAIDAPGVRALATLQDVGFCANGEDAQRRHGAYLPVLAAEGPIEEVCGIRASDGRLPASADEIMLPESYRMLLGEQGRPCELGERIELPLGQREVALSAGEAAEGSLGTFRSDGFFAEVELTEGMRLDSDAALLGEGSTEGDVAGERLVDVQSRSFTVVGFYEAVNMATVTGFGPAAVCGPDPEAQGTVAAYVQMEGFATSAQLRERLEELFPGTEPYLHSSLLLAMGVRTERGIWDTFCAMVAILAVVIVGACVSLIYNAFAISVSERTQQFGLLASIGASRRQLRHAVLLEALVVAAVGVPVGMALGLGGLGVVLAALGPSIAQVIDGGVALGLHASAPMLAFTAALALATVLASAWLPARRASAASAMEALRRAADLRVSRRAQRQASSRAAKARPWRSKGVAGRLFGIGGQLASINARRSASQGRTASLSLALAVVLLVTAGSLTTYLSVMVGAAGAEAAVADVTVAAYATEETAAAQAELLATYQEATARLGKVEGAVPQGAYAMGSGVFLVPDAMAAASLRDGARARGAEAAQGQIAARVALMGLSDEEFRAYAAANGLDGSTFFDAAAPRAIAVGRTWGNDGTTYLCEEAFAAPGTVELISDALWQGERVMGVGIAPASLDGEQPAQAMATVDDAQRPDGVPLGELDVRLAPIEVAAVAQEGPAARPSPEWPTLVVPLSMMAPWGLLTGFACDSPSLVALFDAEDHEEAAIALEEAAETELEAALADSDGLVFVTDHQADAEHVRTLIVVVNVFCLLFTGILMLIAIANVFNTIASGLLLRRREFAVMRSIGMGRRAFRSMVAAECLRCSARGLVPGAVAAVLVSWALYCAVRASVQGVGFAVPWAHLATAVALVALALLASVAYGLRRSNAGSPVEGLRDLA